MNNVIYHPLSHPQRRIWYTEMMQQGTSFANLCAIMKLKSCSVNIELLKKAVNLAIQNNEALRIRIVHGDSGVQQYVAEYQETDLELIQGSNIEEWFERQSRTPFALFNSPLSYFALVKYSEGSYGYFIKLHHVIADGFSFSILNKQIVEYYERLEKGQNIEGTARPSYFEYFNREEAYLSSQKCIQDREYWLQRLTNLPEPLVLGTASAKNDITSTRQVIRIVEDIQKKIESFCHQHETTLFRFLLTVFSIYLARIYNHNDIIIGTAYFNRESKKELNTIGMYVSTIPVRILVDEKSTFVELLNLVQQQLSSDMAHQQYPYDLLVQDLRNAGESPDGLLNMNIVQIPNGKGHKLITRDWHQGADPAILNMVINPRQLPKGSPLEIAFDCRSNVFNEKTIDKVFNCLLALIQDIIANHQKPLSQLEIMSEDDKQQILAFGGRVLDYDRKSTFIDLFKKQVIKRPKNTAIVDEDSSLTYEQTNLYSERIAKKLMQLGVKENSFVGIMLPRRKEFMVSLIGTMKAGGAYVPLDSDYPQERIEYMLHDSGANVLITQKKLYEQKGLSIENVIFIEEFDFVAEGSQDIKLTDPTIENLAYMIYTSGSTGKPKGVMIRHKSLAALLAWRAKDLLLTEQDKLCCHSSFSFDASVDDLFTPLIVGAQLHIISEEMRQNIHTLHCYIQEHKITGGTFSTQFGTELINQFDLPLKYILMGGEKLKPLRRTNIKIINGYGPTEFTVCASYHIVDQDRDSDNIPIGKPVANSWAYVLDTNYNLMPIGMVGELYIAGAQMALGYWNRSDLTTEKFIDNPFKTCEENARMYRTGDLARWNESGELEYVGRIDNQVKLRGFRIELGEIENAIARYPGIIANVTKIGDVGKAQHLCAYFTANSKIDTNELRAFLSQNLTEYMVPTVFLQLARIPLTPNGKVDTKALPAPVIERQEIVLPQNEMQQQLYDLTVSILGTEEFGITDDLFSAGMTSILAIKLSAAIYSKFQINVKTNDIFEQKTIEKLETIIKNAEQGATIETFTKREYYPLTENQCGIYYEWEKDREALQYNTPEVVKFSHKVEPNQLKNAVEKVIKAHPYLNTCLGTKDGQVVQLRKDEEPVVIQLTQVSEAEIQNLKATFVQPFNLFEGPLYRVAIYVTEQHTYLFMDIHHIIIDGSSLDVFITDLVKAYKGEELKQEAYTAFERALEEEQMVGTKKYLTAERFFDNKLSNNVMIELPKTAKGDGEGQAKIVVGNVLRKSINSFCKEYALTPSNLFLAALCITLSRYTREETIALTAISSGRNETKLSSIMGMLVKTLPIVVPIIPSERVAGFVKSVQENMFETLANEIYPFTKMAEKHKIVPQVNYGYQGGVVDLANFRLDDQNVEIEILALNKVKFPLAVYVTPKNDNYEISIEYDDSLYTNAYIESFCSAIAECASQIAENSDVLCKDICIVNAEQQQILERFNQTHTQYSNKADSIVAMFKQQVEKTPKNIAVVYDKKRYTYQELDQLTDKLAKRLKTLGVGVEQPVGILIDRSEYMVIYPLAVLKAGGAYMPLDYSFPSDRLEFMLKDAGVQIILSEQNRVEEHIPQFAGTVIKTEELAKLQVDENINLSLPSPEDMFIILYTSGSTGLPKGCILEHHNLTNYCKWHQEYYQITEEDRSAAYANFGFDVHMSDIYPYITCGATVYILPSAIRMDFIQLNQYFEENKISVAFMTTVLGRQFVEQFDNKSLRIFIVAGEKLLPTRKPAYKFYNGYGPTECFFATVYEIESDYESNLIGRPLANYQLYVVDANLQLLPVGAPGELCIGGDGVSRGYLNREDVTREKFIMWNGKRVYRTGDLVRWTYDGEIEYMGRMDGQIKLRGLRIELGEIESQLLRYEGITSCAVDVKEIELNDSPCEKYLCGYFTAPKSINLESLKQLLAKNLPTFMVPSIFMQIPAIPVNQNGKVNRRLLPIPDLSGSRNTYTAPRNENEKIMADIWQEVLGIDRVGIEDDFFDLGGHSLKASMLINKVKKVFQVEIAFKDVFDNPILKDFVVLVNNGRKLSLPPIEKSEKLPAYPLLIPQKKMLDFALKNFGNCPLPLEITGKINGDRLWEALETLVKRHDILRSSITFLDGQPVQIIADTVEIEHKVRQVNIRDIDQTFREFVRPFSLSQPPLWRAELWELDTEHYIFMLDLHHLIYDGSSIRIIIRELVAAYEGKELPPLVIQFTDYAVWQDRLLQSGGFRNMEDFWLKTLTGAESSVGLPTDAPRQVATDYEGRAVYSQLSSELTRQVYNFAIQEKTTAHVAMMSVYSILLAKYSGKADIIFEEGIAGRNYPEIENLIGMFVNIIPIRSFPQNHKTFREFLREMNEALIRGYESQEYPVAKLAKKLQLTIDQDLGALQFDIGFVFQSMEIPQIKTADWEIKVYNSPVSTKNVARRELLLTVSEAQDKLVLSWVYRANLFKASSIEKMADDFKDILTNILANPETKLEDCY